LSVRFVPFRLHQRGQRAGYCVKFGIPKHWQKKSYALMQVKATESE